MTKEAAIKQFFSGFDIPAYPSSSVPKDVVFPYLVYEAPTAAFDGGTVSYTVNLWYYSSGESGVNAKAREIAQTIGLGTCAIPCDGGGILLSQGAPWCIPLVDEVDPYIKRRQLNITAEYITPY